MPAPHLLLDYAYAHEEALRDKVFLTQPVGSGRVKEICKTSKGKYVSGSPLRTRWWCWPKTYAPACMTRPFAHMWSRSWAGY